ncbi:MAG TPA: asparagine synthase (glutamine-hydrolyzing) [Methylomirabilota bacterium]|jgi:asparagine synthase (glutamine-hydrolysing)
MCGIFGVRDRDGGQPVDESLLKSMGAALRHRGPDDEGFFVEGTFGFGMRRLSIIDLHSGHQPLGNEDGSLQIVFNGEIYNYRELTPGLRARGHTLRTSSDTEVVVHLFEDFGPDAVHHLRGMFAFAIWDRRRRSLLLARDRLGIKPLYYASVGGELIFASELKAILRSPAVPREVDPEAVVAYLRYGYVPDPLAIFKHVRKLPPGHLLTCGSDGRVDVRPYWDPVGGFTRTQEAANPDALVEELRGRLRDAVRSHLVSDVPVGAFLSGGVDSSAVVAFMASEVGRAVKTFSIGFPEREYNELPYARRVAERFETEHHELIVEPATLPQVEGIICQFDEPFADASAIPTYFVSALAAREVKVALSGDGGDEIFAGYDRYVVDERRRRLGLIADTGLAGGVRWVSRALPEGTPGKNFLFNLSLPRVERYLDSVSHFAPARLSALLHEDFLAAAGSASDVVHEHVARSEGLRFPGRLQYLDLKTYLPGDILTKVDRMSMAHSLEARVPLLDHELVEFAAGIPSEYQLQAGETKRLFKRAIAGVLPDEVLNRPKQGFAVPLEYWLRGDWDAFLHDSLFSGSTLGREIFDGGYVRRLHDLYRGTRRRDVLHRLWTLVVFETWARGLEEAAKEGVGDAV